MMKTDSLMGGYDVANCEMGVFAVGPGHAGHESLSDEPSLAVKMNEPVSETVTSSRTTHNNDCEHACSSARRSRDGAMLP